MIINHLICSMTKLLSGTHVRFLTPLGEDIPKIYFANHQSHLDAFVIYYALPEYIRVKVRPVAKKEYWKKGYVRQYLSQRVVKTLLIEEHTQYPVEHPLHPVNQMIKAIDQGSSLLLFPEGTRNCEEGIHEFKSGLYHVARQRPQIDLIPIYVENTNRILPKGEYIPVPILGRITFGEAFGIKPDESKQEFLDRARVVLGQLGEMK